MAPAPANASAIPAPMPLLAARDDRTDAVEPERGRPRRAVRCRRYPSVPPANGWRASAAPSRTDCVDGSLFIARAIDSFVAW